MMYEPYKRKTRRPQLRRGCLLALAKLLVFLLALVALCGLVLYALPPGMFSIEPDEDLSLSTDLPLSPVNILLLGVDRESQGLQRSDTVLIASIDRGSVKLTSILRDTVVEIPGRGKGRINTAFTYGGPELAVRTVNQNFGMNIMHYIVVDFVSVVRIVDALGGVDIDITQAEMEQINANVKMSAKVFKPLGYTCDKLTIYGPKTHLNGLQALGYARIRKIDSDFVRASRQRTLMAAMQEKTKAGIYNPALMIRLASAAFDSMQTSLNPAELASIGLKALGGEIRTLRLPVDGSYNDTSTVIDVTDFEKNKQALRGFLYD